jgi:hypothetical protein
VTERNTEREKRKSGVQMNAKAQWKMAQAPTGITTEDVG